MSWRRVFSAKESEFGSDQGRGAPRSRDRIAEASRGHLLRRMKSKNGRSESHQTPRAQIRRTRHGAGGAAPLRKRNKVIRRNHPLRRMPAIRMARARQPETGAAGAPMGPRDPTPDCDDDHRVRKMTLA